MAGLSETFTEELEQLLLASELTLLPGIYFFNPALHLAGWALAGPPKLNYKCCTRMATSTLSFRGSARRSCSLRVDFLLIFGILNKIGVPGTEKYGFQAEGAGQDFSSGHRSGPDQNSKS